MNLNFRMFVIHSKYMCRPRKAGDSSQFNSTFLTNKIVPAKIEDNYTYFKDIVSKLNTAAIVGCPQVFYNARYKLSRHGT